jgi:glutamate-ammonia-ligase adenylyltransferase
VLLGLGKLGGQEMSYNSDLDLILVYEGDGRTRWRGLAGAGGDEQRTTDNFHFFSELAQKIIKTTSHLGPRGRLYQVDMRLRPTGGSGSLVIPLAAFGRYYREGGGQLWERQALTRARVVHGDPAFGAEVMLEVREAAHGVAWRGEFVDLIRHMRKRLEASRGERDLKRGFGGIVDVEFLIQLMQIKYGKTHPAICQPNTWDALAALAVEGLLAPAHHEELRDNYDFLRRIESRSRIVYNLTQDELPTRPEDLEKLARRLGYEADGQAAAADNFWRDVERRTNRSRALFLELTERER